MTEAETAVREDAVTEEARGTHWRLLTAAEDLFAEKGYNATGIREIAAACNMQSASLYHYARTKEELLFQIIDQSQQRYVRACAALEDSASGPRELIANLVWMHVVTHALLRRRTLVADNELHNLSQRNREYVVACRDAYETVWAGAIAAGTQSGIFAPRDAKLVRLAVIEACTSVSRWYSVQGEKSASDIAEAFIEIVFSMLNYSGDQGDLPRGEELVAPRIVQEIWAPDISPALWNASGVGAR